MAFGCISLAEGCIYGATRPRLELYAAGDEALGGDEQAMDQSHQPLERSFERWISIGFPLDFDRFGGASHEFGEGPGLVADWNARMPELRVLPHDRLFAAAKTSDNGYRICCISATCHARWYKYIYVNPTGRMFKIVSFARTYGSMWSRYGAISIRSCRSHAHEVEVDIQIQACSR